ncbi:MAG: response regulator, partial [Spirochaetes bacterium]|nr:response regulator [Spirochaetota bacterium]
NIDIITEFLKIAGFNSIISATNGQEVIDIALDKNPDLILMDVQMPIIDGLTAVKILREKNYKKPIIMLSAFAMQSDIDEGMNCGANAYVTKPINFSSFFHYIDSFLNKKNAEKPDKTFLFKKGLSDNIKNIFLGDVRKKLVIINDINSKNKIRDNLEEIRIITHGYKGNAKYFGFSKLEDISIAITNAIEDNVKSEKLKPLVSKLIDILEKIVITNN